MLLLSVSELTLPTKIVLGLASSVLSSSCNKISLCSKSFGVISEIVAIKSLFVPNLLVLAKVKQV